MTYGTFHLLLHQDAQLSVSSSREQFIGQMALPVTSMTANVNSAATTKMICVCLPQFYSVTLVLLGFRVLTGAAFSTALSLFSSPNSVFQKKLSMEDRDSQK